MNLPVYAPLNIDYDRFKLRDELNNNLHVTKQRTVVYNNNKSEYYQREDGLTALIPQDELARVDCYTLDSEGQRVLVKRGKETFQVGNFTHIEGIEDTKHHIFYGEGNKRRLYVHKHIENWLWRDDISVPYLKEVIASLPFRHVQMVRLISLFPRSIGVIHRDSGPLLNAMYYKQGGVTISLNACSGNAKLFFDVDNEIYCADNSLPAWHFNDCVPHCVSQVNSAYSRMQVRIWGIMDPQDYINLMDMNRAVFMS